MKNLFILLFICLFTKGMAKQSPHDSLESRKVYLEFGLAMDLNLHAFSYNVDNYSYSTPVGVTSLNISIPVQAACMFKINNVLHIGAGIRYASNSFSFNPSGNAFTDSTSITLKVQTLNYFIRAEFIDKESIGDIIVFGEFGSGMVTSNPGISYSSPIFIEFGPSFQASLAKDWKVIFDGHLILNYLNTMDKKYASYSILSAGIGINFKFGL